MDDWRLQFLPYLATAWGLVGLGIVLYLGFLHRKFRRLENDLKALEGSGAED